MCSMQKYGIWALSAWLCCLQILLAQAAREGCADLIYGEAGERSRGGTLQRGSGGARSLRDAVILMLLAVAFMQRPGL